MSEISEGSIFHNDATKESECLHLGYWNCIGSIFNNITTQESILRVELC